MSGLSNQQSQQQWFNNLTPEQRRQWYNKLTPELQLQYRLRAQRSSQQNGQSQGQQQKVARQNFQPQGQLSPIQQQHLRQQQLRTQHNGQQGSSPMQLSMQPSNTVAPSSSQNPIGCPSQSQTLPHPSLSPTVSSDSLPDADTLVGKKGQRRDQNAAWSSLTNGASGVRPYASSPLSAPSKTATSVMTASPPNTTAPRAPANASSPTRNGNPATLSGGSIVPSGVRPMQTQQARGSQYNQQRNASVGSTQTQQPRIPPQDTARYQQTPLKKGQPYAQMKQQPSPARLGLSPSAHPASSPTATSQKRQATDAPDGAVHTDKRQVIMPPPAVRVAPIRQDNNASHQPGPYHRMSGVPKASANGVVAAINRINTEDINRERREQQNKFAEQHARELRVYDAEQARCNEVHKLAEAAALKREEDDKRREELRKDPSANYRHILEVYKLSPLDYKKDEFPNRYLTGLIANRVMPVDLECDLALAIVYAKDHWDYFGQWPKDVKRFADYERERKAKATKDRA